MQVDDFLKKCRDLVVDDYLLDITINDTFIVWSCKTLKNMKCLIGTTVKDSKYYEFTYNGDKEEIYMDIYRKVKNYKIN